ncbi:zinc finger homeobox protein 2 isoform X2 [Rhinoderma darwinii]|uniref:zinc finger homeobox protein 2 isoform X2 n=1 Tax=Rhinoderma darwinii TaxID=43563 RepID=UPI003F664B68
MDADECLLATSGQDERSSWPLDLNISLCPTATKDTPLPPPNPSPELLSASSSVSAAGGGYRDVSPTSSLLQPLVTPSSPQPNYLPKLSSPLQPNCKEDNEDRGEALVGHVLFSSDGTVYLLKGEEEEEGALPSPASPQDSPKSTLQSRPPLTSFRLTATYQGFRSNQISQHTSAEAADLTQPAPGNSPRKQDQPKEKEAGGQKGKDYLRRKSTGESIRTQRVDGTWICLPCQLNFRSGKHLGLHASHFHGLEHPYQDHLASGESCGIIHRSSGQVFLSLLEPKKSQIVLDAGQEPENVALSDVQVTPNLDVIQSANEQSETLEDFIKDTKHNDTKSHVACQGKPESPKLSMGLAPSSPLSYPKCESTGTSHSTEAKDSKANKDEKNSVENWCSAGTEALDEDVEGEIEDMPESNPSASQISDINEQLLANQSFYGPMMTRSLLQMGALHGSDKGGNQTDSDRGPLAFDECTPSSGPQPFQSLSLQGQLSLLHSRNSCKTLKCPKCNWHYKYQQTLDVHMKDKHPESHSHCSYCHSGQQHPRLARGESYNCGYKPYRCEACNYSTTTKGNLTIHMQSDKHLANLQGYQGSGPAANTSVPPLAAPTVNIGQGEVSQTSPTDRQMKQKASWHCKVCNYETNISRNLRIHMTSEKHMQNVLLLHQGLGMGQDNFPFYGSPLAPDQGLEHPLLFNPMHFSSSATQACNLLTPDSQPNSQFLQAIEGIGGSDVCFRCAPCDSIVGTRLGMMSHLRSASHHQNLTQWRLMHGETVLERIVTVCRSQQEHSKVPKKPEMTSNPDPREENADTSQAPVQDETSRAECEKAAEGTTVFCCPFCAYVSPSEEHVHSHAVSQHALQPTFRCPLCQEQLTGTGNLRGHLGHGHNVVSECVEKLLQVAQKVNINFKTRFIPLRVIEEPDQPVTENAPSSEVTESSPPESPGDISTNPVEAVDTVADNEKAQDETACPLCPLTSENSQDLRTHLEKDHPELSPSDIQQACEGRGREVDIVEQEERKDSQENTPAQPQQSTYRKTANFALDKFMDPSRPHKCVVCKESFTQKNILLVHYNSVSHLHKVRKASLDPSLATRNESGVGTTGHGVQTGQDKPYKCTVCHVSYNQSSTLEIHMRSVLHQTRSRSSKQDPAKTSSEKPQRDSAIKSESITDSRGETTDAQGIDVTKKRQQQLGPCMGVPLLPTTVAPPTMPLSMDLSRPPPLVQPSPLFAPSLLPSFPLIPETLLKLQRQHQQLLLPFYLQELKVSGDGSSVPLLPFGGAQQPPPTKDEGDQPSATPRQASEKDEKVLDERDAATGETSDSQNPDSSSKVSGDPTGSAARALLENFGFELVTQYNEGRLPMTSQVQPQPRPPAPPLDISLTLSSTEKLQCGTCGKLFSNRLILKTHEEHMHQRLLPFEALSRYAANFRRTYDSHNPSGTNSDMTGSLVTPLDFSVTSQLSHCSKELEQQEGIHEHGVTIEQLSFLQSLFDFPGSLMEEQIIWVADKTGLSPATIRHWYKQKENIIQENQEEDTDEILRLDRLGHRRFSRTKFSEFQTQALNSFFESSAYPRDSEVEHLSELLGLSGRVIVVWFQNARQKARKQAAETGTSPSPPLQLGQPGERPAANSNIPPCRKCGIALPCIFQLIRHLKICYKDHIEETDVQEKEEESDKSKQKEEAITDHIGNQEMATINTQENQENELNDNVEEQDESITPVTKVNIASPKGNDGNTQQPDQIDQPAEQDEASIITSSADHNQSKSLPSSGHPSVPLMDLSLLIPVGAGDGTCQRKRKHEEESLSPTGSEGGDEPPRDKRLRTTILPEQLDILHRWYLQDSNPTRSTLERISIEVGLKKRVVQVWFQNTRARERKGQYRGGIPSSVSVPRQQDDSSNEGSKREGVNYYYSVPPSQVVPQLPAKSGSSTVQTTCSSILPKPLASCSVTTAPITKPLVNTTQALSGILSATHVLPSLVNPSQALANLANSQALPGLVSPPQALSGLVNPNQTFTGLVNPAQVLSSLVSTSQPSQGLLLASFTAKAAPPILLSSTPEVNLHSSASHQDSVQSSGGQTAEPQKTLTPPFSETFDCSKVVHSEQQTIEDQTVDNQGTISQKIVDEKVATKNMESLMHSPQGGDISDSSSSDPGPSSPGKGALNSEGLLGSSGARRYRTQMSSLQLRILKACYAEYRTPSMQECDCLGGEIGLQKRVVQVWFQNARAKEKKAKLQGLLGTASTNEGPQPTECTHCNIKYGPTIPCRAHIFSRQHIARLRVSIQQQLKEESRYRDTHPSGGATLVSDSKPASQILNFQNPATVTPQIQRLTPLLMPGQGIPGPIGGLATFNTGPPPGLIGMTSSVPSALLPRPVPSAPISSHTTSDTTKDSLQPALTPETTGPSALKASPLLGAPFMPFSLAPAATPLFSPQIQGPYFQQLYGLKKRLFPINPVIPHTLLGLLPAPLKLAPEISSSRKPEPSHTKATSESSGGQESTVGEEESVERDDDLEDEDIPMVDVAIRYQCQRCKTSYDEEGEVEAHQHAGCYTGPPPHPPPLRVRVCTYHCLSCQVLLQGPAARSQHLRSQQHRACSDGASSAIPQLRPKSAATSVLMAL